jgi:hypothetical protein
MSPRQRVDPAHLCRCDRHTLVAYHHCSDKRAIAALRERPHIDAESRVFDCEIPQLAKSHISIATVPNNITHYHFSLCVLRNVRRAGCKCPTSSFEPTSQEISP